MGAYTGEITAKQVADLGLKYTLVGHSERRKMHSETDSVVAKKTKEALMNKLSVVLCIGETEKERESGKTDEVNARQLEAVLKVTRDWKNIIIAYEPVWAIGTGKTATPEIAQDAHAFIRAWVAARVSYDVAEDIRIIYGGSVSDKTASDLIS